MNTLELVLNALSLNETAFVEVIALEGLRAALLIVFFAGLSNALGQSVVLFANEVKPRRFMASLFVGACIYVFGFLFYVVSIWLVEQFLFARTEPFRNMVKVVSLAYSPYLFSFFVLVPYFGSFISVFLSLWSLAAILIALIATLQLSIWQALICSILGWALIQVLGRSIGRPLHSLTLRSRRLVAGKKLELDPAKVHELISKRRER